MSFGTILTMAGGLGLFLFGMELMSDSIEKVAGARLRRILEIFTTNRFMGMIVGIIFTGIIQSSSACTVDRPVRFSGQRRRGAGPAGTGGEPQLLPDSGGHRPRPRCAGHCAAGGVRPLP